MSISSDEVNFLIYRYLQENGFSHSAFTFAYESLVIKSTAAQTEIPPGALITFLQKGLEYIAIEEHITEDGTIQDFDTNYSLLAPMICEALVVKEDRRMRKSIPSSTSAANMSAVAGEIPSNSQPIKMEEQKSSDSSPSMLQTSSGVRLIEEESGQRSLRLVGHQGEVFTCVWNPNRHELATGSADGICRLWSLQETQLSAYPIPQQNSASDVQVHVALLPHVDAPQEKNKDVTSVAWSPDGQYIATGSYDGKARIWCGQTGDLVSKLDEHKGAVFSFKWSKNGRYLLSGSYDKRAIVWEVTPTGSPPALQTSILRVFSLHDGPVLDVDWKDSEVFATCSSDRKIMVCGVSSPAPLQVFSEHSDEVNAVSWSGEGELGQYLASCSDDSTAKIYTLEGTKFDLRGHGKEIFTLRWTNPSSTSPLYLCTASFDGTVKIWGGETGELVYSLSKYSQPIYALAPSPMGGLLAAGSGGHVMLWDLSKGEMVQEFKGEGDTFDVSWSHDGELLCSSFSSGQVLVLPIPPTLFPAPSALPSLALPPSLPQAPSDLPPSDSSQDSVPPPPSESEEGERGMEVEEDRTEAGEKMDTL